MDYRKTIKLERIPRTADAMQWDGSNTSDIQEFLGAHLKTGELVDRPGGPYIFVRCIREHSLEHTLWVGEWLLEGMDGKLRFYSDAKKRIMYQGKNDELERLRAFAVGVLGLIKPGSQYGITDIDIYYLRLTAEKNGITIDSLKGNR